MMSSCKNCEIEIPEYERIKYLGYCMECIPQNARVLKRRLIFICLLGFFLIFTGVGGLYVTIHDLIIAFSITSTPEGLMGFLLILVISLLYIVMLIGMVFYGILLLKGSFIGFRKIKTLE